MFKDGNAHETYQYKDKDYIINIELMTLGQKEELKYDAKTK